ncbi:G5 domain-containing protein [Ammoniphilus sp. 3BR4]|uniref:G5 domain-containing protein n=1 Tax=Ammoniphilus sp. 3BR4 TaxID=3158265 RepID=UPI003466AF79
MVPGKAIPSQRKFLFVVGILAALFIIAVSIWLYQATQPKQVEFVHNGDPKVIQTKSRNVEEFLTEKGVHIDSYDLISPAKDEKIVNGLQVKYTDRWPVVIVDGTDKRTAVTNQTSVESVLKEQKITLNEWDRTEPSIDSSISSNQQILITRVEKKFVEEEQIIPFNEVKRKDYLLNQGQQKVVQEGREGKAVQRYEIVMENGEEKSKTLVDTKVLQPKQDRVVAIGTLTTVSRGGMSFVARKVLNNVVLTAYSAGVSHTGKGPDHPQYAITASGRRAKEGQTVAVDPSIIPLGTWVYIEGIGLRRAEDTGGAVKGNKIDIYYESDQSAHRFGKRKSKAVYVIGKSKPE